MAYLKNKNFYSLIIISFFVFGLLFFVPKTIQAEVTVWRYTETTYQIVHGDFETQLDCANDRALFFEKNPNYKYTSAVTMCQTFTIAGLPINTDVYEVPPQKTGKDINFVEKYTLLAPIGDFTEIETNDIGKYFNRFFLLAIGLAGALAVVMIIIGGVEWMGSESVFGKTEGKKRITSAVLGLLIALGSYALLNTINPDLLGKRGLSIDQVSVELEEETVPWSTYEVGDNIEACPGGYKDVITGASPAKINVCGTIADKLNQMIAAAKEDGIILSGAGSRSKAIQQTLRERNNCPDPKTPSNKCHPNQVAQPGKSNHEKGLAVDFNCNGSSMGRTDTNNKCYKWLVENAGQYGFKNNYNLIKETWHWSTTGT
jgi:hypothetical protein